MGRSARFLVLQVPRHAFALGGARRHGVLVVPGCVDAHRRDASPNFGRAGGKLSSGSSARVGLTSRPLQVAFGAHSSVAQLVEQAAVNRRVPGSSPGAGAKARRRRAFAPAPVPRGIASALRA